MSDSQQWRRKAACRGLELKTFYSEMNPLRKSTCAGCTVREECLAYVLKSEDQLRWRSGFWAGMSALERNRKYGTMKGR